MTNQQEEQLSEVKPEEIIEPTVRFGIDDYITEHDYWAKHHKTYGIHIKREYSDGKEPSLTKSPELLALMVKYEDRLIKQTISIYDREDRELKTAVDYHLPLKNLDYQEADIEDYSIGSSNTSQVSKIRLFFKIEQLDFIVEDTLKTSGTFAMSFHDLITGEGIRSILDELSVNKDIPFKHKGIAFGKDIGQCDGEDYFIVGIDQYKRPVEFGIDENELLNSLIKLEVFEHVMTIDD